MPTNLVATSYRAPTLLTTSHGIPTYRATTYRATGYRATTYRATSHGATTYRAIAHFAADCAPSASVPTADIPASRATRRVSDAAPGTALAPGLVRVTTLVAARLPGTAVPTSGTGTLATRAPRSSATIPVPASATVPLPASGPSLP